MVLLIVPLAILDDFSNNGIIPFVMNARNSHLELIAKTHPIRVEIMLPFLWILITFSNQRIYFRMILVPENRVRQQRKSTSLLGMTVLSPRLQRFLNTTKMDIVSVEKHLSTKVIIPFERPSRTSFYPILNTTMWSLYVSTSRERQSTG